MSWIAALITAFSAGVIVGLCFGPATERLNVARVDGWLAGYKYGRNRRGTKP